MLAVPSLLLLVYANGVEYAELTTSTVQSGMLTYQRLLNTSEDMRIIGLDEVCMYNISSFLLIFICTYRPRLPLLPWRNLHDSTKSLCYKNVSNTC